MKIKVFSNECCIYQEDIVKSVDDEQGVADGDHDKEDDKEAMVVLGDASINKQTVMVHVTITVLT